MRLRLVLHRVFAAFGLVGTVLILISCDWGGGSGGGANAPARQQIRFDGIGEIGIFDASLELDPSSGTVWMSYSEVLPSPAYPESNPEVVQTRVASSEDGGRTWTDSGIINPAQDVSLGAPFPAEDGTWHYEVSSLVYDSGAALSERWKLVAHHYLVFESARLFEHGWIEIRSASNVAGLAGATPVKLFVGAGYDSINDTANVTPTFSPLGGAPVLALNTFAETSSCLVATEPALFATADALYASLMCRETGPDYNAIILLKCDSPCDFGSASSWNLVGTLLDNADAAALGGDKLSAPELIAVGTEVYIGVSPVTDNPVVNAYNGCRFLRFTDIDSAAVDVGSVRTVNGTVNSFNGACTYDEAASVGAGVILAEVDDILGEKEFRLYRTFVIF